MLHNPGISFSWNMNPLLARYFKEVSKFYVMG